MSTSLAPFSFFGGKQRLARRIVALMPPHRVYVEPYGGSLAVFFTKEPAALEIVSDADGLLINFFRVLRDPIKGLRLREALELTPYAREEWADARLGLKQVARGWDSAADDVELARRWFVLAQQGFAGRIASGPAKEAPGWRFTANPSHNPAQSYRHAIDRLPDFMARLRYAQIEHDDALNILARYDRKQTLAFIDPPYLPDTRRGGGYGVEMTFDDHARLLDVLTAPTLKSMVILSGYDSALYRERLEGAAGWQRLEINVLCSAAGRTRASGLQGEGSVSRAQQTRTEILWLNPAAQQRQGLWASLNDEPTDKLTPTVDTAATPAPKRQTTARPTTPRSKPSTRKGKATHE